MTTASATPALDTLRPVTTPEGCQLLLRPAGPTTRARAWLFDFLIRLVAWIVLGSIAGYLGRFGFGLFLLGAFLLEWFYPVVFEVLWRGQTPGKRICGLTVLQDDGTPIGWGASLARNTLRFVDFLPALYGVGFVAMLLDSQGKRLGDLAAGTVVVHSALAEEAVPPPASATAEPPPFPLTSDEQRALIEYGRRAGQLTPERAGELALAASPLTGGLSPEAARARLVRIANFLLGHR